jgi:probable rRNA maturation factor
MATRPERAAVLVAIQNVSAAPGVPGHGEFDTWCRAALAADAVGEITVRGVDVDESADLNARYRGREGPTNVLSFPADADLPHAPDEPGLLGDIVICAPLVAAEAEAQGKPAEAHWAHLVVHGVLHLMGYDHEAETDAEIMESRERRILAGLGFDDPYRER